MSGREVVALEFDMSVLAPDLDVWELQNCMRVFTQLIDLAYPSEAIRRSCDRL
jgi:hypothetical protein